MLPRGRVLRSHALAADPERRVELIDGDLGFAGWTEEGHFNLLANCFLQSEHQSENSAGITSSGVFWT